VLVVAIVPAAGLLAAVAAVSLAFDIPIGHIVDDPLAEAGAPPLLGFLSNLGLLLWAGAAGASLVAYLAHRHATDRPLVEARWFFAASAALSTILVLDDTYQFHERLLPQLLGRGQTTLLFAYVVLVGLYVLRFRRVLASTAWLVLAAAGFCFAVSLAVDVFPYAAALLPFDLEIDPEAFASTFAALFGEEAPKFLGIVLWFAYHAHTAAAGLVPGKRVAPDTTSGG
jgi:hypothetical protein